MRRALQQFPFPEIAQRALDEFYVPGGKSSTTPFKPVAMPTLRSRPSLVELTVLANFAEVFLAKEGHSGLVGINYLEKIQLPTLASIFGAMLARADYVLMGAGIPRAIPGVIDHFARGAAAELRMDVAGATAAEPFLTTFDPSAFCGQTAPQLHRPQFLGIVASATLAMTLARKASGRVDGFIVEGPTAGGHNAPPRGALQLNPAGEPIYGPRDVVELEKIQDLGLPFWLAGSYGRPGGLAQALSVGAAGIQVGTAFAFCEESGIRPELKRQALELSRRGQAVVFTDPRVSPAGFPFKVAQIEGTLSDPKLAEARPRICDLGYLRHLYRKSDGTLGYRCPAEPVKDYLRKGGALEETVGRQCICNGLVSTVGLSQTRPGRGEEPGIVTAGDEFVNVAAFVKPGRETYTAAEVLEQLLAGVPV